MEPLEKNEGFIAKHWLFLLVSILVIGLFIRLWGINFGLPYIYDSDETHFVDRAFRILVNRDLNPHWFGPPASTLIYMLAGIYTAIFFLGRGLGIFASFEDFHTLYYQDPTIFYLSGRLLSAVFAIATILLVYFICQRLFNKTTGIIAAALVAVTPWHVQYSQVVRMDIPMTFLVLVAFWYCLDILEKDNLASYILAGFFTGLAIVTKFPALVFVLTIILTYLLNKGWRGKNRFKSIFASATACLGGAFLGSPFLFLDFQTTLVDVRHEARPLELGATGQGLIPNITWYLQNPLTSSFTFYGLLLIGVGIVFCLISKQKEKLTLISFPIFFLLFIASLTLIWNRWIIPAIPFGCIILAYAMYEIAKWIDNRLKFRIGFWLMLICFGYISTSLLNASVLHVQQKSGIDTKVVAAQWMLDNIPPGSSILVEHSPPPLPKTAFQFFEVHEEDLVEVTPEQRCRKGQIVRNIDECKHHAFLEADRPPIGHLKDIEEIKRKNIEYVVTSWKYDKFLSEREKYPDIVETYEKVIDSGTLIYEGDRNGEKNITTGPKIRVFKLKLGT